MNGTRWTGERIARLGYLIGLGWAAARIAKDPIIATTENNVFRQCHKLGLAFSRNGRLRIRRDVAAFFDDAAEERGMTREVLIQELLKVIAQEPVLFSNLMGWDERKAA